MEEGSINIKSKFNSSLLILQRLDRLFQDSHRHSRSGEYIRWNEDLDRIWVELCDDSGEEDEKKLKEINKKITTSGLYGLVKPRTDDNKEKLKYLLRLTKIRELMMEKEVFLRKLQKKQGKGIGYEDPEEDEWE